MRVADFCVPGLALTLALGALGHGCRRGAPSTAARDGGAPSAVPSASSSAGSPPRARGNVRFAVSDASGRAIPCKLTLVGRDGTPTPDLAFGQPTASVEGGLVAHHRVYSLTGSGAFTAPEGDYDVYVSHGLEWSLHREALHVGTTPVSLTVALTEQIPTPGWLSADMHVHAAPSWDSDVPLLARVHEFVAEGVDVLVATDHNVVTDFRPEIERAGARELLATVAGTELSTTDWGHFGAFPMRDEKGWWMLHGVRMNGMQPDELLGSLRRHAPTALVTVNHPRLGTMGYFGIGGLDPASGRFARPRVSLAFDAVEVMNGAKHGAVEAVDRVMQDWFGLLRSGRRVTAVGNSDTHELRASYAGYPRNYARLADAPPALDGDRLAAVFREGQAFFTSGPFVEAHVAGRGYGELAHAHGGRVRLALRVLAADWVPVSRVRIYVDGELSRELAVAPDRRVARLSAELDLEVSHDTFVVVRVDGDQALPPVVAGPPAEVLMPLAVTNPIWVDADGDGRYRPPQGRF